MNPPNVLLHGFHLETLRGDIAGHRWTAQGHDL